MLVELAEGAWYSLGEVVELQSVVVGRGVQSTAVTARLLLGLLLSTTSHVAVDAAGVAALRPSTDMQLSTAATNARPVKSPFAAKRR